MFISTTYQQTTNQQWENQYTIFHQIQSDTFDENFCCAAERSPDELFPKKKTVHSRTWHCNG